MNRADRALNEIRDVEELASIRSPVRDLHPLVKLEVTLAYIIATMSFSKYDMAGLVFMIVYPAIMYPVSGISLRTCFYKLRIVLPIVCAVGLVNPFLDRTPLLEIGGIVISGGVVSMLTLMLKGTAALTASFLLIATTPIDELCAALRKMHVPGVLVTLLLFTYRYIALMVSEVGVMTDAYRLRAPGHKGIHFSAWGSFLGQLLLRSMDRAEEVYSSMQLRGFNGSFRYAETCACTKGALAFAVLWTAFFAASRLVGPAYLLGSLFVK